MRTMTFLGPIAFLFITIGSAGGTSPAPAACLSPARAYLETGAFLHDGPSADAVLELTFGGGNLQTLTFLAGTCQTNMINAINLFTPVTNVSAAVSGNNRARIELRAESAAIAALHLHQAGDYEPRLYVTAIDGHAVNDLIVTPQPGAPFDLTCDGAVGINDLLQLLESWGECPNDRACPPDFNQDGVVNVIDLLRLLENFAPA